MNWETFKKPLVIAHRGFTKGHPENTLESIRAAIELGADGIETDLRLTKDGEVVIFHDPEPEKMSLAEVSRRFPATPTLQELLERVNGRCLLNLEIKNTKLFGSRIEEKILQILQNYPRKTLLFSSFHPPTLMKLRHLAPDLLRGQLFTDRQRFFAPLATPLIDPFSIHMPLASLTKPRLANARAARHRVFVWTVNGEDAMKKCLNLDVDGLITDEPDRLLRILRN